MHAYSYVVLTFGGARSGGSFPSYKLNKSLIIFYFQYYVIQVADRCWPNKVHASIEKK